jgi:hypothetical protein
MSFYNIKDCPFSEGRLARDERRIEVEVDTPCQLMAARETGRPVRMRWRSIRADYGRVISRQRDQRATGYRNGFAGGGNDYRRAA